MIRIIVEDEPNRAQYKDKTMIKVLFISLAVIGMIALCWHVAFLTSVAFFLPFLGTPISWGFCSVAGVITLGVLYLKGK
jgi:uncharacterized membrane protein (DUF485 family)